MTVDAVSSVSLYPIKSCQAASVDGELPHTLGAGPGGLSAYGVRDREYVLAEANPLDDGSLLFISQRGWGENGRLVREHKGDSQLASVQTDITKEAVTVSSVVGSLVLSNRYEHTGDTVDVRIHSSVLPRAIDQGTEPADYFSEILGRSVRLLRANRSLRRLLPKMYRRFGASNEVAGGDGFPILLTNEASLRSLHRQNGLAPGTVPMSRYRPNVVVAGDVWPAFTEDYIEQVRIGEVRMFIMKACARCPIPNIDQATGEITGGGLTILRQRQGYTDDPKKPHVYFGQNATLELKHGATVSVNDPVTVLKASMQPNFSPVH